MYTYEFFKFQKWKHLLHLSASCFYCHLTVCLQYLFIYVHIDIPAPFFLNNCIIIYYIVGILSIIIHLKYFLCVELCTNGWFSSFNFQFIINTWYQFKYHLRGAFPVLCSKSSYVPTHTLTFPNKLPCVVFPMVFITIWNDLICWFVYLYLTFPTIM